MIEYIKAKTIVTRTKSQEWFGTEYNMNLYRGCSHGCIYCDSRSECYRIDNFDKICVKENALELIRDELKRKVKTGVVGTGAMSDPYNPLEKRLELTRHALELLSAFGFGAAIATKSDLIIRDIDVLKEIAEFSPVICKITITAASDELAGKVEPFAPASSKRFEAVEALSKAGVFAGILLMPVLPFIEDNKENISQIVKQAKECGAKFIYPAFGVTARQNQREYYLEQLEKRFPGEGLKARYESQYGYSYQCTSPKAKELWELFAKECSEAGIHYTMPNIIKAYKKNYEYTQLRFT